MYGPSFGLARRACGRSLTANPAANGHFLANDQPDGERATKIIYGLSDIVEGQQRLDQHRRKRVRSR
ncbi:hypothetical protein KX816_15800 [Sphingosinicellaceae bacterium]|nr:hypothetical protein KX816_15800 [Sphingosinicellaceae bacterium]